MKEIVITAQITVALTLINVWIFRYQQMKKEFDLYRLPDWLRIFTFFAKVSIAGMLILGIWYQNLTLVASQTLAILMVFALLAHIRVKNPPFKFAPALSVLLLCVFINFASNV